MSISSRELRRRAAKVQLLLMDVDGVLTDGRLYYVPNPSGGFLETKTFHSRDGLGVRFAREAGLKLGVISGRCSPVVEHRIREMGVHYAYQSVLHKLEPYQSLLKTTRLKDDAVCYIGDDLIDLPILKRVGLAVGVGNGHALLRRHVHYWTRNPGGSGAVRETIELILTAQGKFATVLKNYLK